MKLNAAGVNAKNITESIKFYELLGFKFQPFTSADENVETIPEGGVKLMIDTFESVTSILGETPRPSNHSSFAVQYDSPAELNAVATKVKESGFTIFKEPWDAFWGQRYAIVEDPSGYKVDLYATLA